jgi:hypothetical protein
MYRPCSRFKNGGDRELCGVINKLGGFLHYDWGLDLRGYIDKIKESMSESIDHNEEYQEVLELLYSMGVGTLDGNGYRKINKVGNGYSLEMLKGRHTVRDEHDKWMPINKLNTNHSDLAELVTEVFIRSGKSPTMLKFFKDRGVKDFKNVLLKYKESLHKRLDTYFPEKDEIHDFTKNINHMSSVGDGAENYAKGILEKIGFKTIYQGGDGDFMDMIYGIDLIMEWKGKNYLIQVKNKHKQIVDLFSHKKNEKYYKYISLYVSKRDNEEGIVIIDRAETTHLLDGNGKTVSKTTKDGQVQPKKT